jgi:hypothetical protein
MAVITSILEKIDGFRSSYMLIPDDFKARSSLFLFIDPKTKILARSILAGVTCTPMKGISSRTNHSAPSREMSEFRNLSIMVRYSMKRNNIRIMNWVMKKNLQNSFSQYLCRHFMNHSAFWRHPGRQAGVPFAALFRRRIPRPPRTRLGIHMPITGG